MHRFFCKFPPAKTLIMDKKLAFSLFIYLVIFFTSIDVKLMPLIAHRVERVEFRIFVLTFFNSTCMAKPITNIRHVQIDDLPRT